MDNERSTKEKQVDSNAYKCEDSAGYFNDFEHHVGSERLNSEEWDDREERIESFDRSTSSDHKNIRKSTEEFLKMKRDEFWDTHKDSIEDTRMINEAAEYHEQLTLMRQIEEEERLQQERQQREMKQQQLLLAQQQAFKQQQALQAQQQQQQLFKQPQPTPQQLQAVLMQIEQTLHGVQVQYTQQTQLLQRNYQPIVLNITNELNQAIQLNDTERIQRLRLQQQSIEQQFQSQVSVLQQQLTVQSQSLQSTQLNIKTALHNALQLHCLRPIQPMQRIVTSSKAIPEFRPSEAVQEEVHNDADIKQIYTIQENETDEKDSDTETLLREEDVSRTTSNASNLKISTQSVSPNVMSPSISPMKLVSSPAPHPSVSLRLQQQQIAMTRSLPNSPLIDVQSLAEISKVSLTPQFTSQRKKQTANKLIKSLPNSPFFRSSRRKRKMKRKEMLSPLILNGSNAFEFTTGPPPPTLPKIVSTEEIMFDPTPHRESTSSSSSSSTSEEEEEEEEEEKSSSCDSPSLNSIYSYSSMSTVFTGVHDGMLLANHSVYLSRMDGNSEYNKMSVVNDIKSLWLQVFSIAVLCRVIQALLICWLSAYGVNNSQFAGFLLGMAVLNMIGQLMMKGMTSPLSTICDELYNANCKPLIGIELQKMIGFALIMIMPMVTGAMLCVQYAIHYIYRGTPAADAMDVLDAMDEMIEYCVFCVAPLTLFYVFERYLQGSHVLHVNGYVAACLVSSLVAQLGVLVILQEASEVSLYRIVLISMVCAYAVLFVSFSVAITFYKLHFETCIFAISFKHLCSPRQWIKYLSLGLYRCALLFCMFWYFDFMILMAAMQGVNELIAFGILCAIYHVICSVISAAEFVAKSLIFRGLLHSSIEYARDAWKYTVFFGFFLSVIIGGVFFLLRENISACCCSNSDVQNIMNDSWLYLYILIIANGIKYGLVGGAQAMGYIKLVSAINLLSFYCVTIPVAVWSLQYGLHAIYLSILCGFVINIICLLVFRGMCIHWHRELKLFTLRAQRKAQTLQQSVKAVHIQLQHYNKGRRHRHHRHRKHHKHRHKRNMNSNKTSVNSFGRVSEMPLGRQRTNDTTATATITTTTATGNTDCQCHGGEAAQWMVRNRHMKRKRRTIWEDLFDVAKQYCCCCLFDGCCTFCKCNECCEECWYYWCGCCCSESYLRDDYTYHMDINDHAKYKIIHEDECKPIANKPIQLEIHNDELKHSLISHNSMAGVSANNYCKDSLSSQY